MGSPILMDMRMICPECGKTNFDDSTQCAFCRKVFQQAPSSKPDTPKTQDSPEKTQDNGKIKCPSCGAGNDADTPCCNLCGEIFKIKLAPAASPSPASPGPEPLQPPSNTQADSIPSFMSGRRDVTPSMIPTLILYILVLGIVGGGGYWVYSTFIAVPTFGVSEETPVGKLETIRNYLITRAYQEKEPKNIEHIDLPVSGDMHFFVGNSPVEDWDDFIILVTDEDNDLIAVYANFFAHYEIDPYITSKSGNFMWRYWQAAFKGRQVNLKEIMAGKGIWRQYAKVAVDSTVDAEGRWTKQSVNRRKNKYARAGVVVVLGEFEE